MQQHPAMGPGDDEPTLASIRPQAPGWSNVPPYGEREPSGWNAPAPYSGNQAFSSGNSSGPTPYNGGRRFSNDNGGNRKNNRPLLFALIIALVVLVLLFSTGIYAFTHSGQANQGGTGNQQGTITPSVGSQPTADATATTNAQASVNATATSGTQGVANATATANAQGIANATATAVAQVSQFNGTWLNDDANTAGIPGLIIKNSGQIITVHGYGACQPTYCDWGTRNGTYASSPFMVLFDFGNGLTHQLAISFADGGGTHLQVVDTGSSSGVHTYFFHRSPVAYGTAAQFNSTWLNVDPNTQGIPKLIISSSGNQITVHGYGACSPTDCDWGTRQGTYTGSPFVITFAFSNGITNQLTISFNDVLGVRLKVVENGSASGVHTYYFNRG